MADTPAPHLEAYQGDKPYVFVSYSHQNSAAVVPEMVKLQARGYRLWFDEGIDGGSAWPDEIAGALENASYFLVFITPDAVKSRNVQNEINFALNEDKELLAVHLVETELPPGLRLRMGDLQALFKHEMTDEVFARKIERTLPVGLLERRGPARSGESGAGEFGEAEPLVADLTCANCGNSLRMTRGDALCPKCGHTVGKSSRRDLLQYHSVDYLQQLRAGALAAIIAIVLTLIGSVIVECIWALDPASHLPVYMHQSIVVLGQWTLVLSAWIITRTPPGKSVGAFGSGLRWAVAGAAVTSTALRVWTGIEGVNIITSTESFPGLSLVWILNDGLWLIVLAAFFLQIRKVMNRIPNRRAAAHVMIALSGISGSLAVGLVAAGSLYVYQGLLGHAYHPDAMFFKVAKTVAVISRTTAVHFLIWMLVTIFVLRAKVQSLIDVMTETAG